MNEDDFYLKIAHALEGCQHVELELRLYITEALELAKKCIGDRMAFKMSGEDYENSSLEKLISIFKKLSDNATLVGQLNRFKDERNKLAHEGITRCLNDYEDTLSESVASEYQGRLEAIQTEAQRLRIALHEEANKFRGHLYFDVIPKAD
jgi:hypothetical protein